MQKTASEIFTERLKEGEFIEWAGQPKGGLQIREVDLILIPASIILLGFAAITDLVAFGFDSGMMMKIVGILLSYAGIHMGVIRFIKDARRRAKTFYCLTNKRLLMISGSSQKLKTLPLKNVERMELTEEKNNCGHITFGSTNPLWPFLFGHFYLSLENIAGLENISEAKKVYALIEKMKRQNISENLLNTVKENHNSEN